MIENCFICIFRYVRLPPSSFFFESIASVILMLIQKIFPKLFHCEALRALNLKASLFALWILMKYSDFKSKCWIPCFTITASSTALKVSNSCCRLQLNWFSSKLYQLFNCSRFRWKHVMGIFLFIHFWASLITPRSIGKVFAKASKWN